MLPEIGGFMSRVRIVTDSTSCLPPELIRELDISIVPVGLIIEAIGEAGS